MRDFTWLPKRAEIAWSLQNKTDPVLQQTNWRFRDDSEGEVATNSWLAAENANVTLDVNTTFRLRMVIQESANAKYTAFLPDVHYRKDSGAWTPIGDANVVWATSANVTDETVTTDQLGGTGTFSPGYVTSGNGFGTSNNVEALGHAEIEATLQILTAGSYEFKVLHSDQTDLSLTAASYPTVTAQAASSQAVNESATDGIVVTDASGEIASAQGGVVEGVVSNDAVTETVGYWSLWSVPDSFVVAQGGVNVQESVSDGILTVDTPDSTASPQEQLGDGVTLGESLSATVGYWSLWSAPDSFVLAQGSTNVQESVTDGILALDSASTQVAASEQVSDGVTASDTENSTGTSSYEEIAAEGIQVGDTTGSAVAGGEAASETILSAESVLDSTTGNVVEVVSDGVVLVDTASAGDLALEEIVSEVIKAGDSALSSLVTDESVADGLALGDAASYLIPVPSSPSNRLYTKRAYNVVDVAVDELRTSHMVKNPVSGLWEPSILVEGESTNLVSTSEPTVAELGAGGATVIDYQDATLTAQGFSQAILFPETLGTSAYAYMAVPMTPGVAYAGSIFVKMLDKKGPPVLGSSSSSSGSYDFAVIMETSLSATVDGIDSLGNDLYRIRFHIDSATGSGNWFGISRYVAQEGRTFAVTGYQVEEGTYASSYIPTVGSSATRARDDLGFPFTAPPQAMTVYLRFIEKGATLTTGGLFNIGSPAPRLYAFSTGTDGSYGLVYNDADGASFSAHVTPNVQYGELVEFRGVLTASYIRAGVARNNGTEAVTGNISHSGLPARWAEEVFHLGQLSWSPTWDGANAFTHVLIEPGELSMAEMRTKAGI